jgi:hypothetical protein
MSIENPTGISWKGQQSMPSEQGKPTLKIIERTPFQAPFGDRVLWKENAPPEDQPPSQLQRRKRGCPLALADATYSAHARLHH